MNDKYFVVFIVIVFLGLDNHVLAKPTQDLTKTTLDSSQEKLNNTKVNIPTKWERGMDLLGQIMDSIRFGRGRLVNFLLMARNEIAERAEEFTSDAANKLVAILAARDAKKIAQKAGKRSIVESSTSTRIKVDPLDSFLPPKAREIARLESESGQSLFEIKKPKPIQGLLENFLAPVPLVDKIKEEDKYGNSGDKFIGVGRAIVNGFEGFSNFLNAVVDIPVNAAKKTSRGITAALNQIGGKLIGLE
ncbi:uncharacterized protein [Chelonus insularis]|uniref:uncharacterized protein isoform X1 n=1 Tax=Chelonus insularis TaxID=460826 RepID=UPI00158A12EF|nr:uncharacterized protein LOC118065563 isoform X1 [Chelonus insularis]